MLQHSTAAAGNASPVVPQPFQNVSFITVTLWQVLIISITASACILKVNACDILSLFCTVCPQITVRYTPCLISTLHYSFFNLFLEIKWSAPASKETLNKRTKTFVRWHVLWDYSLSETFPYIFPIGVRWLALSGVEPNAALIWRHSAVAQWNND